MQQNMTGRRHCINIISIIFEKFNDLNTGFYVCIGDAQKRM